MAKYSIGVDFGTLSGRALLLDLETGEEAATAVLAYPRAVMDTALHTGEKLGIDWALQHPDDYLLVLRETVPALLRSAAVRPEDVIGLAIDFTACTLIPVKRDATPLSSLKEYERRPHAYVKLWKHHAAQPWADRINAVAAARGEPWLARYGGRISSEWLLPKTLQMLDEDEELYNAADLFVEAADWLVWRLTGVLLRNVCCAGFKAAWNEETGFPSRDYLRALDPRFENLPDKLAGRIAPMGERAGGLTPEAAAALGLLPGTPVAVANTDAQSPAPAVGLTRPGSLMAIIGTSICYMILGDGRVEVPGMCGVVRDGVMPGHYAYEAGQACAGDVLGWYVDNCLPASCLAAARESGTGPHEWLTAEAAKLAPGESGLLALDWWNGNRSVLVNMHLSGMILGMTLTTRPPEIYRAIMESVAFGARKIVEAFDASGVAVDEIIATGGIPEKNPFMMQMFADVTRKPVKIAASAQGPAYGSALYAAVAAGKEAGGFADVREAAAGMGSRKEAFYTANARDAAVYDVLYDEFTRLHDYFGRGGNDVMERLKKLAGSRRTP